MVMKRRIPGTGTEVSCLCLGTMTFGTPVGEPEAIRIVHAALDCGVNFFDTANMYEGYARFPGSPGGVAEEILGKALRGRRGEAVVATKVGMKVGSAPEDEGTSARAIEVQLERSLRRLGTDRVDIYYLHRPDPSTPLEEILRAMERARAAGKAASWGISNYSAAQTAKLLAAADAAGAARPVIHQMPYSLLAPDTGTDLLPLLERERIAAAPYRVLQGGLLTGKYRRGAAPPPGSRRQEKPEWLAEPDARTFDELERLEAEARAKGRTLLAHALRTTLEQPTVVSLVLGVKSVGQLDEIVAAISR